MNEQPLPADESDVTAALTEQPARQRRWIAPAWFLFGMIVGAAAAFAAYTTLNARPDIDPATMREAARDGTLDAIATLQAGGPAQPSSRSPAATNLSFAIREANRIGDPNAPVTVFEFSDFQ